MALLIRQPTEASPGPRPAARRSVSLGVTDLRLRTYLATWSRRSIAASAGLRQHQDRQKEERQTFGKGWKDHGLVFATGIGTPIEPRNLNRHLLRLLERAGLRRVCLHDLHHSCATLLYEQGVPIEKIQDVLGHSFPRLQS